MRASGKREAVELYTILDRPLDSAIIAEWEGALEHFRYKRWDEAAALFGAMETKAPFLKVAAALYLEQIAGHRQTPPVDGWAGEVVFKSK